MTWKPWRSQPVFVSSTFRDMQAERDHLHRFVFPELQERLRERRLYLEPVDLRWGVDTFAVEAEEDKERLVLSVCFDEIDRSWPFVLVLLGGRYGWVPPLSRAEAIAQETGLQVPVVGKSVTALEIEHGVLGHADRRAFVYCRDLADVDMDEETHATFRESDPANGARLDDLKRRLWEELPDRCRKYSGAGTLSPER